MCEIRWCHAVVPLTICSTAPLPLQGHIPAARAIGDVYYWGKGVTIDYPRAMAAYKIAAEAGDAVSQYQVGAMYCKGLGVAVDYKQGRAWLEKAAAQDDPDAVGQLGTMYFEGRAWPRAGAAHESSTRGRSSWATPDGAEHAGPHPEHRKCNEKGITSHHPTPIA